MKILVLTDAFPPDHTGGISKSLQYEVRSLADRGHDVTVLTRQQTPNAQRDELSTRGYRIRRYPGPLRGTPQYYAHPWLTMWTLPKQIRQLQADEAFDVVYVHNTFQAAALQKANLPVRQVWSFHAPAPREVAIDAAKGKYGFRSRLVRGLYRYLRGIELRALSRMDHVFTRSGFMGEEVDLLYQGEILPPRSVIPLCVDTVQYCPPSERASLRAELNLPLHAFVLVTVRRLVARMGIENLLRAVASLVDRHPDLVLCVCGKGYLETALRDQAKALGLADHIRFEGFVDEGDLPKYYQAADLFVLPTSELEGFGLVTLEALSCGTPVLATPVGANPSVLSPLGKQFLTESAEPSGIADGIEEWLSTGVSTRTRQICRDFVMARYAQSIVAHQLEAVFEEQSEYRNAAA